MYLLLCQTFGIALPVPGHLNVLLPLSYTSVIQQQAAFVWSMAIKLQTTLRSRFTYSTTDV